MDVGSYLEELAVGPLGQRPYTPEEVVCRRLDYLLAVGPLNAQIKLKEDAVRRSLVHAQAYQDAMCTINAIENMPYPSTDVTHASSSPSASASGSSFVFAITLLAVVCSSMLNLCARV